MAQTTDTNISNVKGSTLSGLIAALKNGFSGSSSGDNMFSDLLSQTENSLPKVEARTPAASSTTSASDQSRTAPAARSARHDDDASDARVTADDAAPAAAAKDEAPAKKTEAKKDDDADKVKDQAAADDAKATVADKPKEKAKTADQKDAKSDDDAAAAQDAAAAAKDEKEEDRIAAMLATFVPLAETKTKAAGEEAAQTKTDAKTEDDQTPTDQAQALALAAMNQAQAAAQPQTTPDMKAQGTAKGKKGDALDALKKADTASDTQTQLQAGAADDLKTALKETAQDKKDESLQTQGQYAKMVAEASSSSQGASVSGAAKTESHDLGNLMTRGEQTPVINAAAQAFGTAAASAAQTTASSGEASPSVPSVGSTSGTTQTNATVAGGEGVRTAGSYDFASQLSATRVTKGGSAGLPQAVEQVSIQLNKAAKDGLDEITIQLRPAELGKIEVKLEFGADKSVTGTVIADNQATLNMLQKDSASLQRALQDAGLQADAGCMQFSLRNENGASQFAQQQRDGSKTSLFANDNSGSDIDAAAATTSSETYYVTPGRVNLRV